MYNTLVPTTEGSEAEDAAKWDYSEDAKHLPKALTRVGITREAFSDALFAAVDNVRRTLARRALPTVLYLRVCATSLFYCYLLPKGALGKTPLSHT